MYKLSVDFDFTTDLTLLTTGIEKLNAVKLTYQSKIIGLLLLISPVEVKAQSPLNKEITIK